MLRHRLPALPRASSIHSSWRFATVGNKPQTKSQAPTPSPPPSLLFSQTLYQGNTPHEHCEGNLKVRARPLATRLASFGMPKGYPLSCAPGYGRFFYLYIAHAFISNFSMSIATQALLGGFFAESTPQVWMIKDLAPSLVAAYLANKVASYELRPKYWMLISVVLSQGASILDLIIPIVVGPKYLLAAAIATAVVKQNATLMHFVARASVLQHFAIYQNLGEVQKKLNSFGMINFTIATALGIGYTTMFPSFGAHALAVGLSSLTAITLIHLSLSHVAFRVLSPITGQLVMQRFISSDFTKAVTLEEARDVLGTTACLPSSACAKEVFAVNPPLSALEEVTNLGNQTLLAGKEIDFTIGIWKVKEQRLGPFSRWWGGKKHTAVEHRPSKKKLVLFIHRKCPPMQLFLAHLLCYSALSKAKEVVADRCDLVIWEEAIRSFFCPSLVSSLQQTALTAALEDSVLELEIAAVLGKKATAAPPPTDKPSVSSEDDLPLPPAENPPKVVDPQLWTHGNETDGSLWLRRTAMLIELLKVEGWDIATPALDPIERRISTKPETSE